MKNLVLVLLVLGIALAGLQAQASANLITDPGLENGGTAIAIKENVTDWTWSGGANGDSFYSPDVAKSGAKSAKVTIWGGSNTDYAYFVKDLTGIDFTKPYQFSANFLRNSADDLKAGSSGTLQLKWQNSSGAILRQDNSVVFDASYGANVWNLISLTSTAAPAGTTKLSAVVALTTTSTYSPNSTFFVDDMDLQAVPEPASLLLFGSGLAGLVGLVRKKRS
jgi:hypothetical protein